MVAGRTVSGLPKRNGLGGKNLPNSWPVKYNHNEAQSFQGEWKPGLWWQALIRRGGDACNQGNGKHQLFLSLLLPSGQLPNSPPTLVKSLREVTERMKTSYHSLRNPKGLGEKEQRDEENHYSWIYQQRDFHNKYRKTCKSSWYLRS